jgi:hypothetical protein
LRILVIVDEGVSQYPVLVVAGGGAGHEPMHIGYVGHGMLDAARAGRILTSPTPDQILAAAATVDNGAGIRVILKNDPGDIMNFKMAAEIRRPSGVSGPPRRLLTKQPDRQMEGPCHAQFLQSAGRHRLGRARWAGRRQRRQSAAI